MSALLACDLAALVPWIPDAVSGWNESAVQHLHRRLGYGLSPLKVSGALSQNPLQHIRAGLAAAAATAPLAQPPWGFWKLSDYSDPQQAADQVITWRSNTVNRMREAPWRAKMELFWLNHFVTQLEVYGCPSYMWQYHQVVQQYAFGDFREFVRSIGRTPAMLIYLNGVQNTRIQPNENYARELFELFTLGRDNGYTQADIVEAARALTGFNGFTEACAPIGYLAIAHDPASKTIFGQVGNYTYDGLIDLIFSERAVQSSEFICSRLYSYFVSPDVDSTVVAQLAATLRSNNWSLLSVYDQLFTSAHFFSEALRAVRIKDPFELALTAEAELGTTALQTVEYTNAVWFIASNLGQLLFDPPDVAGWPGNRQWINANFLSLRTEAVQQVLFVIYAADRLSYTNWAKSLEPAPGSNAEAVTRAIVNFVLPKGLPNSDDYLRATQVFKAEVPSYYFDSGIWNLDFEYASEQVLVLLDYLFRRPEYQLC